MHVVSEVHEDPIKIADYLGGGVEDFYTPTMTIQLMNFSSFKS